MIDKAGTLRQMTINDLPVGRDVDETLRLVQVNHRILDYSQELNIQNHVFQAFQFTDEHGEVCPAGWRPGEKNILCELELGFGKIAPQIRRDFDISKWTRVPCPQH